MITVAQIGVGYWGPNILRNLVTNASTNVLMVADFSQERGDYVNALYPNIEFCTNPTNVINDDRIDAIIIATPVHTHFSLAMECLHAGKHVLVEKPMAMNIEEIDQIESLSKKHNLVAMVGHTFLFNSAVRYIKKIIDDGLIGDIRYIYSQRTNLGRIRNDIDALWNLAPHDISIIQYWLDECSPIDISRKGMAYVQNGIDDVVFLNIKYPNNIIANIHVSWLDPHKIRKMTIVGTKKMIAYDDISENKITIYDKGIDRMAVLGENMDFDNSSSFSFNYRSGDIIMPKLDWIEPLKAEIDHFAECIMNDIECIAGTKNARSVVKILENSE
jgi:predicted dehydrogenase